MLILLRAGLAAPEASECQPDVAMQLAKCPKQLLNSFFSFKMEVPFTSKQYALGISRDYRTVTVDGSFSLPCSPPMPIKRLSSYICINKIRKCTGTGLSHIFLACSTVWFWLFLTLSRQHSGVRPMGCYSQWQFCCGHSVLLEEEESWAIWT